MWAGSLTIFEPFDEFEGREELVVRFLADCLEEKSKVLSVVQDRLNRCDRDVSDGRGPGTVVSSRRRSGRTHTPKSSSRTRMMRSRAGMMLSVMTLRIVRNDASNVTSHLATASHVSDMTRM